MRRKLIGFTGPAGCGKTTAAACLSSHTYSFATPMKDCLKRLFDLDLDQLYTLEGKEAIDPRYGVSPRFLLQRFGTEFIRSTVPDLWIILMRKQLNKLPTDMFIVIDDVRFEDEAEMVRQEGGTIVHILGRSMIKSDHSSERLIGIHPKDLTFSNNGSLKEFNARVKEVV